MRKEIQSREFMEVGYPGNPNPVQIFKSTQDDHTPAYSPDGRRIAFASTRSGTEEIWLSNADGSRPIQLTSMNGPTTANPAVLARRTENSV